MHQRERLYARVVPVMVVMDVSILFVIVEMLAGIFGFLAEPATDVGGLGRGIVEPAFEQ